MYTYPNSTTLELDRLQHDRPAACFIAQQHSSVNVVTLRSPPTRKNTARFVKYHSLYFLKKKTRVTQNLHYMELRKSEMAALVSVWRTSR
jgi:hypothetical protein